MASQTDKNTTAGSKNRGGEATSSTAATPTQQQGVIPPSAAASTLGVPTPTPGAPSTTKVSRELLGQLLKTLRPDLEISQLLGLLTQSPQASTSAVPPESKATPSSVQPILAATDEPTGQTRATSGREAVPSKEGKKATETVGETEATMVMVEKKGADPQVADIVMEELPTGPTEEPERFEPTEAEPGADTNTEELAPLEDDDVQMATVQEALTSTIPSLPEKENVEGTEKRVSRWRKRKRIVEETESEEEEEEEEERILEEKLPEEKQREGKQTAKPKAKKVKFATWNVVIREPVPTDQETPQTKALTWGRQLRRKVEKRTESTTQYKKSYVKVDDLLLQKMVSFDDPKREEECRRRVGPGRELKSGKELKQLALQKIGAEAKFLEFITGIGFEWLLETNMPAMPVAFAQEFFTSFRFKATTNLEAKSISFRLCTKEVKMSLKEWSERLGLYNAGQEANGEWFGRDLGQPRGNPAFDHQTAWRSIAHERAPEFKPASSRGDHIKDPILRLAQIFLGYNLLGRADAPNTITQAELYFMWCMKEQRKVHLGYWIAHTCNAIATQAGRHLNVCHLLGTFVQNNLTLDLKVGPPNPPLCPVPELFDLRFLLSIKVLTKRRTKLYFYDEGLPDIQEDKVEEKKTAEEDSGGQLALIPQVEQREEASTSAGSWNEQAVGLLRNLVDIAAAQHKLMEDHATQFARAIDVIERMLQVVRQDSSTSRQYTSGRTPPPPKRK